MRVNRVIWAAAALMFFSGNVPANAQRDQQGEKEGRSDRQERGGQSQQQRQGQPQRAEQQQQQRAQQPRQEKQTQPQRAEPQRTQPSPQERQAQQPQQQPQRAPQPVQPQQQQRAQQQQQQQQQQQRVQQPPPRQQQQQQRAQQSPRQQPQRSQQQAQAWQQQRGWLGQGGWQGQNSWQQNRARNWSSDHRTWSQRGGYGGYYIPWDRFGLNFGRQHSFRIRSRPGIYMGYPRFEYGGFAFLLVDPWPEYWAEDWYNSDDVYIDYDDGYYLFNNRYPQVRLAISIVL